MTPSPLQYLNIMQNLERGDTELVLATASGTIRTVQLTEDELVKLIADSSRTLALLRGVAR